MPWSRRVAGDVELGPGGERVDLDHVPVLVERDDRGVAAGRGVDPLEPGHPGLLARQGELERPHLAELAALGRPARPLLGAVHRVGHGEVEVVAVADGLDVLEGLGEVGAGVEEDDLDLRVDRTARSMSTASWKEQERASFGPKRSTAQPRRRPPVRSRTRPNAPPSRPAAGPPPGPRPSARASSGSPPRSASRHSPSSGGDPAARRRHLPTIPVRPHLHMQNPIGSLNIPGHRIDPPATRNAASRSRPRPSGASTTTIHD